MLIDQLIRELIEIGAEVTVAVEPSSGGDVRPDAILEVTLAAKRCRFAVEERRRAPYPAELSSLTSVRDRIGQAGTPLLVAPYVSAQLGQNLLTFGWSWADAEGNYDLAGRTWRLRNRTSAKPAPRSRTTFPRSAAGLRIVRALVSRPGAFGDRLSQRRLAAAAGVTQPRVSQILAGLEEEELVSVHGRQLTWDREALCDAFLAHYHGPGGAEHSFYTLDPLRDAALALGGPTNGKPKVAISADVAADLLAPARRPTHLVAYLFPGTQPGQLSLDAVQVDSRAEANITLREPGDESVFGPIGVPTVAAIERRPIRLADPTQVLWDLADLGGRDRAHAAEVLRRWILSDNH